MLLALILGWICSCEKLESYPNEPSVEFLQVYIADTVTEMGNDMKYQKITIRVTDGDGNLGLDRSETTGVYSPESEYYNNLFITISEKQADGSYQELKSLSEGLGYRIPYKAPVGQNVFLRAEVSITLETPLAFMDYDTIRYSFKVVDKDLNESEIAHSCDIAIRRHGTIWAGGKESFFPIKEPEVDIPEQDQ